jgi:hypothetical protein
LRYLAGSKERYGDESNNQFDRLRRVLQHNLPIATERSAAKNRYSITSSAWPGKWRRNGDAEPFGGLRIDVKLDFGYLLDR